MMRAITEMREYGKKPSSSSIDSDSSLDEKPLSDQTIIGDIPWRELKHKLGVLYYTDKEHKPTFRQQDTEFDREDFHQLITDDEKEILQ